MFNFLKVYNLQKKLILTCSHQKREQLKACSRGSVLKKVRKAIPKFFLFNKCIRRSEKNRDIREADDDDEDVRVLSSSSNDEVKMVMKMVMKMTMVMVVMTIIGETTVLMEDLWRC